ncbi:hypothetical protein ACE6H2_020907 [Prunus campanulata]
MVGIEGIVVGIVGNGVEGSGGRVTLGAVGMVGNVGFGIDGIWVLGKEGNVGFGSAGIKGVVGSGGNAALGSVGKEGSGGNVALGMGRDGMVGSVNAGGGAAVSRRCRAARLTSRLDKHNAATIIDNSRKQCLKPAILVDIQDHTEQVLQYIMDAIKRYPPFSGDGLDEFRRTAVKMEEKIYDVALSQV